MISGNNGVLTKATDAKKANEQGTDGDRVRLAAQAALIDGEGVINTNSTSTSEKGSLYAALVEEFGAGKVAYAKGTATGTVTLNGKQYTVTSYGSVTQTDVPVSSGAQWKWTDNDEEGAEGYGKISAGDLIEYKAKTSEKFYVIGKDGDTVKMLARYNLKKENDEITIEQDTTEANNPCAFSSTNYWSGSYPLNLNDYEIPSTATSIITTAADYGGTLDVETGRLMTVGEVENLGGSMSGHSTSGCTTNGYAFINSQSYWLGSADSSNNVWFVQGQNSIFAGFNCLHGNEFGVRPVLEISASSIE